MPRFINKMLRLSLLPALIWAFLSPLPAQAQESYQLKPFQASYEINWDGSISLSGKTVRELSQQPDNSWLFESKASALLASITESSAFNWRSNRPEPAKYIFKRSVLGKKRHVEVQFDWTEHKVTNKVESQPWSMNITEGVQDKISYQLLLQKELAEGKKQFTYSVADGGKLKQYRFAVDGTERIDAPIGSYDSIRVKRIRKEGSQRQTYIWFAPELDFQIIKLQQIEKQDKAYTLLLKKLLL